MLIVTGGNLDRWRFLIESMPPADYLAASYYERWLAAVMAMSAELGILDDGQLREIQAGRVPAVEAADVDAVPPEIVQVMVNSPRGKTPDMSGEPAYRQGDRVRARVAHSDGHTRLPRYVRGRRGTVVNDRGNHFLPDARAADGTTEMQRLYTVSFTAVELWGERAHSGDTVRLDLWESYLEPT
jgi:nitrile hydratase